jgi:cold shock CspA family protein
MEPLREVEECIRSETDKLETFCKQIMGCRVAVEVPHSHHRKGRLYHIRIDLTVPGSEIVVKHAPNLSNQIRRTGRSRMTKSQELKTPHHDLQLTIRDAFRAAGRRLQDYARRHRGNVKFHESRLIGRVTRLVPDDRCGFLTTFEGREIYFHEDSVLNRGFRRLKVGSEVSFVEEQGEKGPQASTVRINRKRLIRQAAAGAAVAAG